MKQVRFMSTKLTSYMATTYSRPPITLVKGRGSTVWDSTGKEYTDFTAGIAVTALGHSDPGVTEVIEKQAGELLHCSNLYFNEWAPKLSAELVQRTKRHDVMSNAARVFLCNSGTEANEAALKFARKKGTLTGGSEKNEILAFNGGFHGRTFGALSATSNPKYQAPFSPMVPGFNYADINDPLSLDAITEKTCGVIIEPIQGEGGVNVCDSLWLVALRAKCNEVGAVLIYDEIQSGLGRTGELWAHSYAGVDASPDIVTIAKALGNGFPIGATMISESVNEALQIGDHGTTYGGNPLGSRIALHVLKEIDSTATRENVKNRSEQIKDRVDEWIKRFPTVTGFRGRGLLIGIQLEQDPAPIVAAARDEGLLIITCGTNTIRIVPALNITQEDTAKGLDILESALSKHSS